VAVSGVGVGSTVDRGTCGAEVLPSPLGEEDEDGHDDGNHEDEAGNGDPDGEVALRDAELVGVLALAHKRLVQIFEFFIVEVVRLVHVQSRVHLNGFVPVDEIVEAVLVTQLHHLTLASHQVHSVLAHGRHLIAATGMLDAELDVALVVHRGGVRELVRLESDEGSALAGGVVELAHNLVIHRAPFLVDKVLFTPAEPVPDQAVSHVHAVYSLVVNADGKGEGVPNLDVLRDVSLLGLPVVDLHAGARHRGCGRQRGRSQGIDAEIVGKRPLLGSVSAADVVPSALVRYQFPVGLYNDGVEVLDARLHLCGHGVTGPQRYHVHNLALLVNVLRHTGGVLGQALRVDHPVEEVPVNSQTEGDVVVVTKYSNILDHVVSVFLYDGFLLESVSVEALYLLSVGGQGH